MGGGVNTTDSVEVEGATSCGALAFNGYTSVDPAAEGKMPPDETCSSDPGSGFAHCSTPPSELETKITTTLWLALPDLFLEGTPELLYLGAEGAYDAYDWGEPLLRSHHSGCQ